VYTCPGLPSFLGKRIVRECHLIFRGLCPKCAQRSASVKWIWLLIGMAPSQSDPVICPNR